LEPLVPLREWGRSADLEQNVSKFAHLEFLITYDCICHFSSFDEPLKDLHLHLLLLKIPLIHATLLDRLKMLLGKKLIDLLNKIHKQDQARNVSSDVYGLNLITKMTLYQRILDEIHKK
jgi:hypothetical protein